MTDSSPSPFAAAIAAIAAEAGAVAMRHFNTDCAKAAKKDGSPVSRADEDAEAVIIERLHAIDPSLPIIAEESSAAEIAPAPGARFALVDPVDGTRDFLACRPEFTVNIAVVEDAAPVMGCVYAPAMKTLYIGEVGHGAFRAEWVPGDAGPTGPWRPIHARSPDPERLVALVSRSDVNADTEAYLQALQVRERRPVASSLKFCLLAEGEGDCYPRFQRVMEWDIAAGHALLAAAGGRVATVDGRPIRYGRVEEGYRAPMFIAQGA